MVERGRRAMRIKEQIRRTRSGGAARRHMSLETDPNNCGNSSFLATISGYFVDVN
jgi:hypothetical protein